jgi:endonuclease-3 related protein
MTLTPNEVYTLLLSHFGNQEWWPIDKKYHLKNGSDPRFEIMIGAILTQNTAWTNVEKALKNLKKNKSLTVEKIVELPLEKLKILVQPSGFFNQKALRLKTLATYIYEKYESNLDAFFKRDLQQIRKELLLLQGIGPETADSMLLYAGNHPIFVVDAYTKRICKRIPFMIKNESYEDIQQYFENNIYNEYSEQQTISLYKEIHALLVELAKNYCKTKPLCKKCPLEKKCTFRTS